MDVNDEPVTRNDLQALKTEVLERIQDSKREVLERVQGSKREILEGVEEMVYDAQTEILKAFLPFQEGQHLR